MYISFSYIFGGKFLGLRFVYVRRMNKFPFMAFFDLALAFVVFLPGSGAFSVNSDFSENEDVVDPFLPRVRWERGDDYGRGVGGPVAAGPLGPSDPDDFDEGNATLVDECQSQNSNTPSEIVKDPSNSRCNFEKKTGQVLSAVRSDDKKQYKALNATICNNEADCIQECIKEKCNYFIHNVREKKLILAFFYSLDDKAIQDQNYASSNFFNSYKRICQTGGSPKRHAKRGAPLPRKLPVNPSSVLKQNPNPSPSQALSNIQNLGSPPQRDLGNALSTDSTFKQFTQTFGKAYSGQENPLRANIFQTNMKTIDQLNANLLKGGGGGDSALYGWTPFADLTHDEFIKKFAGTLPEPESTVEKLVISDQDLKKNVDKRESRFDWRRHGVIGRVRSQSSCGSCYAFSTADLIAAQNAIERNQTVKTLSPQYIMDCEGGYACSGGRVGKVMQNVVSDNPGVPLEQCYRYQNKAGTCQKGTSCCMYQKVKWSQTLDVSGPKEKDLMAGLLQWGPVVTVIDASEAWQFHNGSGIIKSSQCSKNQQNHAVLLVGYNFDSDTPYYVVKNSWGKDWGKNGYSKLEAGTNACSVAKTVVTACAHDCDKVKDVKSILSLPPLMERRKS